MSRNPDDTFSYNIPKKKTHGVPVKLKVPTHIEVTINESFFIQKKAGPNSATFREVPLVADGRKLTALSVATSIKYTDKVFTVDFIRPAGGILDLSSVKFDQEQYFASIAATYEERTLQDINTAVTSLKPALARASSFKVGTESADLATDTREVARARFDISEPGWEERLQCFVDEHVTACEAACPGPPCYELPAVNGCPMVIQN